MPTEDGPFTDRFISIMMFPLRCSAVSGLPNRKTISVGSAARIRFKSVCSVHVFRCTRTDSVSITVPSSIAAQSKILYKKLKRGCCKIKSYLQQPLSFFRRGIRGVPDIIFFGSSEAGSCRKCDFCVRQTDLLRFCCSRKVISGCFRFKQCFSESSVSKPTAQFSDIECCCEDKKAGFVVGLPSGEESSEPVILF